MIQSWKLLQFENNRRETMMTMKEQKMQYQTSVLSDEANFMIKSIECGRKIEKKKRVKLNSQNLKKSKYHFERKAE